MPGLEQLRADHAAAVLAFETENRAYFATIITDRGHEFFDDFAGDFDRVLKQQQAGSCAFFVVLDQDAGTVLGRFNLYDLRNGTATVGFRVARHAAGRGLATASVQELCAVASGLDTCTLHAAASDANHASRKVLLNAGFVSDGPADPSELGGKHGCRYRRDLTSQRW